MSDYQRLAPLMAVFFFGGAMSAAVFGSVVAMGGSPITPEIYGPLVYTLPAWAWVAIQISICVGGGISACVYSRWATLFFSICFTLLMVTFALMAIQAGANGIIMVTHAGVWGA
jgi:hypothetical protein